MSDAKKAFVPNAITLITILLSSMVILMGAAAVAPALMPMKEHFGESEFLVSLVVSLALTIRRHHRFRYGNPCGPPREGR